MTFWKTVKANAETGALEDDVAALLLGPSIVDAKGDIIVATGADTVVRKAVGSDGEILVADSAQSPAPMGTITSAASAPRLHFKLS